MPQAIFFIRVRHLGRYADGRPNTNSITLTDINYDQDVASLRLPRNVLAGGYLDLPLTSRVMGSYTQGVIAKLVTAGMVSVEVLSPGTEEASLIIADVNSQADTENGTWEFPYKTIQKAVNALWGSPDDTIPASPIVAGQRKTIYVLPGTYEENIILPAAGGINLLSVGGSVRVGTTITPRTITRIVDLSLTPDPPASATVTLIGGLTGASSSLATFSLYGTLILGNIGAKVQNVLCEGVSFATGGGINATAQTSNLNLALANCAFQSCTVNAPTATGTISRSSFFSTTPSLKTFQGIVDSCVFDSGFTLSQTPGTTMILEGCRVAGTVTCPGNFRVDYTTNGYFQTYAVIKAGGWAATIPIGLTIAY